MTYDYIITESVPHGVGSVLATVLWDLYWNFVDLYGYDTDLYNGTGGNNMVMQLVIDGLKLQACGATFIDIRESILVADELLYEGQNTCLIWETLHVEELVLVQKVELPIVEETGKKHLIFYLNVLKN